MALPQISSSICAALTTAVRCGQVLLNFCQSVATGIAAKPSLVLCLATARPSLVGEELLDQGRSHVFYNIRSLSCIIIFYLSTRHDAE
jgi:hypothetical protein